jgi:cytochrome P450
VSAPGAEREAEALQTFLRLIRPRPLADPYPLHARLRDLAPFLPIRFPGVANGYLVSTFGGCSQLLRDPTFGPPTGAHLDALRPGWREDTFTRCLYRSMPLLTGQSHRTHRQAAAYHFSCRRIGAYRDEIERVASTLLDGLDDRGPNVDLVEQLALPFASLSLGRLLGIADDEAIRLGRLTRQVGAAFDQFATVRQHKRTATAGAELVERLTVIVAGHQRTSELLASLAGGGANADEQALVGSAVLLFAAGVDSPASMVGLGTKLFLEHPDQASLLCRQPDLAPRAVAEVLRYEPPVQLVARAALEPAELEGRRVPQGGMVFGLIAAANRDPVRVKEPETFDVTRDPVPSLSFGAGPHYCLGAYLASMQGEILFPQLLRRFPRMRAISQPVYRTPGSTLRGLDRLLLTLGQGC